MLLPGPDPPQGLSGLQRSVVVLPAAGRPRLCWTGFRQHLAARSQLESRGRGQERLRDAGRGLLDTVAAESIGGAGAGVQVAAEDEERQPFLRHAGEAHLAGHTAQRVRLFAGPAGDRQVEPEQMPGLGGEPGRQRRHAGAVLRPGKPSRGETEEAGPQALEKVRGGETILVEERGAALLELLGALQAER